MLIRALLSVFILLSLTGCFGLAVGTYGTFESKQDKFKISNERGELSIGINESSYSKEDIVNSWGAPNDSWVNGQCEVLSYYDGFSWSGIGAFIIVLPVPILIPSGHEEIRIYIRNNEAVGLTSEYGEVTNVLGYMCGSNECDFKSGAVNTDKTREANITWCE